MHFSINCSTVICSPTVDVILREATSETYGPRVYFPSYKFPIYYFQSFTFRSINQKYQKYLLYLYLSLSDLTFASDHEGIDNPFNTSGCEDLLSVCRGCLCCVAWFSNWFNKISLITEGNTYCRYTASSLPLCGNTDVVEAASVTRWCITERLKRLAGNKIELCMKIPMIESRASNIALTKGITYVVITVRPIKIFVEYVGTNMSI